jgi:DNA-binding LacI/PurR family transcriptional regulator
VFGAEEKTDVKDETRRRIMEEIQRLHYGVAECAHCRAMKEQIGRLVSLLPPDPIDANGFRYIFTPPKEYEELVERRLAELLRGPGLG